MEGTPRLNGASFPNNIQFLGGIFPDMRWCFFNHQLTLPQNLLFSAAHWWHFPFSVMYCGIEPVISLDTPLKQSLSTSTCTQYTGINTLRLRQVLGLKGSKTHFTCILVVMTFSRRLDTITQRNRDIWKEKFVYDNYIYLLLTGKERTKIGWML